MINKPAILPTDQSQALVTPKFNPIYLKASSIDNNIELERKESELIKPPSESDSTNLISDSVESFIRESFESD